MDLFKPGFLPTLLYFAGDYGAAGPRGSHEARHRPPSQEPCQPYSVSQLSLSLSVCLFVCWSVEPPQQEAFVFRSRPFLSCTAIS